MSDATEQQILQSLLTLSSTLNSLHISVVQIQEILANAPPPGYTLVKKEEDRPT